MAAPSRRGFSFVAVGSSRQNPRHRTPAVAHDLLLRCDTERPQKKNQGSGVRDGIMRQLIERNQPPTFLCQDASHVHSGASYCSRRRFLGGLAVSAASTLLADQQARAQATPASEKPFRIDTHHHLSSPGFIAEIAGRKPAKCH